MDSVRLHIGSTPPDGVAVFLCLMRSWRCSISGERGLGKPLDQVAKEPWLGECSKIPQPLNGHGKWTMPVAIAGYTLQMTPLHFLSCAGASVTKKQQDQ